MLHARVPIGANEIIDQLLGSYLDLLVDEVRTEIASDLAPQGLSAKDLETIISKGDGLIWYRRKHYFDPALNQHYFRRSHAPT